MSDDVIKRCIAHHSHGDNYHNLVAAVPLALLLNIVKCLTF